MSGSDMIKLIIRKWYIVVGATVIAFIYLTREDDGPGRIKRGETDSGGTFQSVSFEERMKRLGLVDGTVHTIDEIENFIVFLKRSYDENMDRPRGKYMALNQIESFCSRLVRDSNHEGELITAVYQDCLNEMARNAFPYHSEELLAYHRKFGAYRKWLKETSLQAKAVGNREARTREIWDRRIQMLGREITEDMYGDELQLRKANQAIASAVQKTGTLEERLADFQAGINKSTGEKNARDFLVRERHRLAHEFLSRDQVQEQLRALEEDKRREYVAKIRRTMGFGENEIDKMARVDREREEESRNMQQYGNEYAALKKQYQGGGPEFDNRLKAIREKTFGKERASVIEREEKTGYYRFKEQRFQKPIRYGI